MDLAFVRIGCALWVEQAAELHGICTEVHGSLKDILASACALYGVLECIVCIRTSLSEMLFRALTLLECCEYKRIRIAEVCDFE